MNTYKGKSQDNNSQPAATAVSQKQSDIECVDNRPVAITQKKLCDLANNNPTAKRLNSLQDVANNSPQVKQAMQWQAKADQYTSSRRELVQQKENTTGLPDDLKSGVENLSGYSMDDVKVHFNSDKPRQLQAHAYAEGKDIHVAPGQEKNLPHEAWHVVQQKQGRVKLTKLLKNNEPVNDNASLEREADVMGARALDGNLNTTPAQLKEALINRTPIQRKIGFEFEDSSWEVYQDSPEPQVEVDQLNVDKPEIDQEEGNFIKRVRVYSKEKSDWSKFIGKYMPDVQEFEDLREDLDYSVFKDESEFRTECFRRIDASPDFIKLCQTYYEADKKMMGDNGQLLFYGVYDFSAMRKGLAALLLSTFEIDDYKIPLTEDGQIVVFPSMAKEDNSRHIDKEMSAYNMKAAPKVWTIHKKGQFSLETDGPYQRGKMDIELVTKPFPLTDGGYNLLTTTFGTIQTEVINVLKRFGGKKDASKGQFVGPEEHNFTNVHAYLAAGEATPVFKMQVTHGVSLQNLPTLMKYFGAREQNEGLFDKGRRKNARLLAHGEENPTNEVAQIIGRSPALARRAMTSLVSDGIFAQQADTKALEGFIAYMLMYIQGLGKTSFKGIKESLPFLSRFSMATLFEKLPAAQKTPLKQAKGRTALVKAIDAVMPKSLLGNALDENGKRVERSMMKVDDMFVAKHGKVEKVRFYNHIQKMTVKEWVVGICSGVDFLTKEGIMQYFASNEINIEGYEKGLKIFLRGHADTSNVVPAENTQEDKLAVMENRFISPDANNPMTFEAVRSAAKSYFKFIKKINELNGESNAGKFREVKHI